MAWMSAVLVALRVDWPPAVATSKVRAPSWAVPLVVRSPAISAVAASSVAPGSTATVPVAFNAAATARVPPIATSPPRVTLAAWALPSSTSAPLAGASIVAVSRLLGAVAAGLVAAVRSCQLAARFQSPAIGPTQV